jgi:hypothetical protein
MTDRLFHSGAEKYLRVDDKEILTTPILYAQDCKIPLPTLKGIKFILDEMAETQPRARTRRRRVLSISLLKNSTRTGFSTALEN